MLWIALKFFVLLQSKQLRSVVLRLGLVVNCSQIFCTFAVETTWRCSTLAAGMLWIALKFFVLLQSKQRFNSSDCGVPCCELLSNFLYFCSRNNVAMSRDILYSVVNCSQIFCTFAVETTTSRGRSHAYMLWIALKFFVLLQSKQPSRYNKQLMPLLWIALKFFVLLQSKQLASGDSLWYWVVNCSQIFCTFAVETTSQDCLSSPLSLWIALKFFVLLQSKQQWWIDLLRCLCCELLSNFLYFCSRNN